MLILPQTRPLINYRRYQTFNIRKLKKGTEMITRKLLHKIWAQYLKKSDFLLSGKLETSN